ncbi:MAG TPA: hypothetical protein VFG23_16335, partial [Polyangia bacterium]|nr:hypothetical protein [Polyangia bacterium]
MRHVVAGVVLVCAGGHFAKAGPGAPLPISPPATPSPVVTPVIAPVVAPVIAVQGSCPSLEMITAAVAALIPHGGVDRLPRSGKVEVVDLGDNYRVGVLARGVPRERIFQDDTRDCGLRARFAAVFVVLTLLPPGAFLDVPPRA